MNTPNAPVTGFSITTQRIHVFKAVIPALLLGILLGSVSAISGLRLVDVAQRIASHIQTWFEPSPAPAYIDAPHFVTLGESYTARPFVSWDASNDMRIVAPNDMRIIADDFIVELPTGTWRFTKAGAIYFDRNSSK